MQKYIRKAMCLIICGIGGMMINNDSGYKFNPGTMVSMDINRTAAGINGIVGMPMVGINGHLGLLVALMMIGGRRGHNGTMNQRNMLIKVHLQNGTELILRKPGATVVAH